MQIQTKLSQAKPKLDMNLAHLSPSLLLYILNITEEKNKEVFLEYRIDKVDDTIGGEDVKGDDPGFPSR